MKPSALGLDGWSLADLRSLPDVLLGWLADLLWEVERLGRWPTCLAEGYSALLLPPGPLNTRPLTVLSMVYRLWAGVRLADAITWQESWAHRAAFGFRSARSVMDGAAMTQVLLELCRLRGGDEYRLRQLFRSHPPSSRVGPGVGAWTRAGALGAMYKQLRRAFKVAGALGRWWQATNGILRIKKKRVWKTSIFELSREKNRISKLCTNLLGDPPGDPPPPPARPKVKNT